MIITRKHLPRRTFLRGSARRSRCRAGRDDAGAGARAGTAAARARPVRLAFIYVPNGVTMADWTPKAAGKAFDCTRILKPLEAFREDTLVLSRPGARERLRARRRPRRPRPRGGRAISPASTRRRPPAPTSRTASRSIRSPRSTSATRRASPRSSSAATTRASSATATPATAAPTPTAWRGAAPTSPLPPETNPRLVFERLFGGFDAGARSGDARRGGMQYRRSILDLVADRTRALRGDLGADRSPQGRRVSRRRSARSSAASRWPSRTCATCRRASTEADRHPGRVRASTSALMFDLQVRRLPGRPHARRDDDDGPRGQPADVSGDRRARSAPPADAPPRQPGVDREGHEDQHAPHGAVRLLPREAEGDAGRRRHAARSLDDRLRQRHQRRQPPHPRRSAGAARRQRRRRLRSPAATSSIRRTRR